MSSGGINGRPITIDGRTGESPGAATTTVVDVSDKLVAPYNNRRQFARSVHVHNLDATNDLLVYLNGQSPLVVPPNTERDIEAMVFRIAVQSSAGTVDYNIIAVVAA